MTSSDTKDEVPIALPEDLSETKTTSKKKKKKKNKERSDEEKIEDKPTEKDILLIAEETSIVEECDSNKSMKSMSISMKNLYL